MQVKQRQIVRLAFLWLCVLLLTTGVIFAKLRERKESAYPAATKEFYVADYAHVLQDKSILHILKEAKNLELKTKAQVVVATVPNTHVDSLERYSINLANYWQIGDKQLDNGILILFTTDEPHVRIEVGRGLEGVLPDGKAGRLLDKYAVNAKNAHLWDQAAVDTFNAVCRLLYKAYNLEVPNNLQVRYQADALPNVRASKSIQTNLQFPSVAIIYNQNSFAKQLGNAFKWALLLLVVVTLFIFWIVRAIAYNLRRSHRFRRNMTSETLMWLLLNLLTRGGPRGGAGFSGGSFGDFSGGAFGGGGSFGGGGASR